MGRPPRLSDLPLDELRRILRDTEQLAGPDSDSVAAVRRAIAEKERLEREQTAGKGGDDAAS